MTIPGSVGHHILNMNRLNRPDAECPEGRKYNGVNGVQQVRHRLRGEIRALIHINPHLDEFTDRGVVGDIDTGLHLHL